MFYRKHITLKICPLTHILPAGKELNMIKLFLVERITLKNTVYYTLSLKRNPFGYKFNRALWCLLSAFYNPGDIIDFEAVQRQDPCAPRKHKTLDQHWSNVLYLPAAGRE